MRLAEAGQGDKGGGRITKTKKQLRAEAVERLKNMDDWCDGSYRTAADFMKALLWDLRAINEDAICNALIDLLTDDDANDDSTPESVVSDPDGGSNVAYVASDSRERLEAEVRYEYSGNIENEAEQIIGWLDRQAAITERECIDQRIASQIGSIWKDEKLCELQAKVDELTAEREEYREMLSKALDHAFGILGLMD